MGNLIVSEKFYSIQGEGVTMGIPAVFLRLAGCNILCKGDGWICDSIEVWKKGVKTEFKDVLKEYIQELQHGAHLVITGGEPLLHQKKIEEFLKWFASEYKFSPIVEIETNGTIIPNEIMFELVDYWNCSPKLANSGETFEKRLKKEAIKKLNESEKTIFKFVINNDKDVLEILTDYSPYINMKKVVLMPAGDSQELLNKTRPVVLELCKKIGLRYSDRLHIVGWNQKTGV